MNASDAFADTNVLVYFASRSARRRERVETLLETGPVISVQVLNELANVARRKLRLSFDETRHALSVIRTACDVRPLDVATHERGIGIAERYRFSIYDSMIVAAALQAGCSVLYSEDIQDGQRIEGLTIRNPFVDA